MKNKIKKIIPYLFILIALVGFFGYEKKVKAADPLGACISPVKSIDNISQGQCTAEASKAEYSTLGVVWKPKDGSATITVKFANATTPISLNSQSGTAIPATPAGTPPFQKKIDEGCESIFSSQTTLSGCILKIAYYTIFQLPSGLLYVAAIFFNFLMSMVLQSNTYSHGFINAAWAVVRDLSNIFFILILLYVAIKTVLNMGGHETKSMITSVIIMAVLINFSLFFTKIVIDSSNILALVFYNKLDPRYEDKDGKKTERPNVTVGPNDEKDLSGAIYKNFNATKLLSETFVKKLSVQEVSVRTVNGDQTVEIPTGDHLPLGMTLLILIISGAIMLFAAYAFFTSGIFFLGRIIELWILMISAPFAFMSFALPTLAHTEYGWDKWTEKLLSTSFMAPIFMFFIYLIFLLIGAKPSIFDTFIDSNNDGAMADMIKVLLPALIILGLLLKAKDMAKKGGGQFGEMVMTGAKMAGGLALAATGAGVAAMGAKTIGAGALETLANKDIRAAALGDKSHFDKLALTDNRYVDPAFRQQAQKEAQKKLEKAGKDVNRSFDFRDTKVGKFVAQKSGLNFDHNKAMEFVGWDKHAFEGGVMGQIKHSKEHTEKDIKNYQLSAPEARELDKKASTPEAKAQNKRAKEYEKDLKQAKANGKVFNESSERAFKRQYEKGSDLRNFLIDKKVEDGPVDKIKTSAEVNKEIKETYFKEKEAHHETPKERMRDAFKKTGKWAGKAAAGAGAVGLALGGAPIAATAALTVAAGVGIPIIGGAFLNELKSLLRNEGVMHNYAMAELQKPKSKEQVLAEAAKAVFKEEKEPVAEVTASTPPAVNGGGGTTTAPDTHGHA